MQADVAVDLSYFSVFDIKVEYAEGAPPGMGAPSAPRGATLRWQTAQTDPRGLPVEKAVVAARYLNDKRSVSSSFVEFVGGGAAPPPVPRPALRRQGTRTLRAARAPGPRPACAPAQRA